MFIYLQQREFYYFGVYVGMSIAQGGCGLPFLHSSVYEYLVSGKCTSIVVDVCDMPEPHLMEVVQKVQCR